MCYKASPQMKFVKEPKYHKAKASYFGIQCTKCLMVGFQSSTKIKYDWNQKDYNLSRLLQ